MQVLYPDLHGQLQTVSSVDAALDAICLDGKTLIEWYQSDTPRESQLFQAIRDYPGSLIIVADDFNQALHNSVKRLQRNLDLQPVIAPHSMTQYPFLFGKLPEFSEDHGLRVDDRIVIVPATLLNGWEGIQQSRQEIRTWHELGINLLYYVWYNNHIQKLLR